MTRLCAAAFSIGLAIAALPPAALADAWKPIAFTGPGGTGAAGVASEAVGRPGVLLVIGCEKGTKDAWRGVALLERTPLPAPTSSDGGIQSEIETGFFGRAPVTGHWHGRATADGLLSWPASSDDLRRSLLREDRTRGQAMLQLALRRGGATERLAFGVGGLASHGPDLAASCDGWGADTEYRRRERGW